MSADDAEAYHGAQVETFADTAADMVAALTLTYAEEATGIARAAARAGVPVAISFTVETDGRLADGRSLRETIEAVDAATDAYPAYYMLNCAHPSHFAAVLTGGEPWVARVRGLRANASRLSHAELDAAPRPDAGDPRGARARVRGPQAPTASAERVRRLLRHRPPAPRAHRRGLRAALSAGDVSGAGSTA